MQTNELRGAVLAKFKTVGAFAEAVNWSKNKAYRIVRGEQLPDSADIQAICVALRIKDPEAIVRLFSLA